MAERKLVSTPLRLKVLNKAEGKCEECGKCLFQKRRMQTFKNVTK